SRPRAPRRRRSRPGVRRAPTPRTSSARWAAAPSSPFPDASPFASRKPLLPVGANDVGVVAMRPALGNLVTVLTTRSRRSSHRRRAPLALVTVLMLGLALLL